MIHRQLSLIVGLAWLCLSFTCQVHSAALKSEGANEVVKETEAQTEADEEARTIKPNQLEAFYYGMYGDLGHDTLWKKGRLGPVNISDTCMQVREVPSLLRYATNFRPRGIANYYRKYTEAYGIPVIASEEVADAAVSRACYVLRFLLADRRDLREAYFRAYGRVAIIPGDGPLTAVPEYRVLPAVFNEATPGLGAVPFIPVSSAKENNVLCWQNDSYGREDILIRQIAQGILHLAAKMLDDSLGDRLDHLYDRAIASGWWERTYAALTPDSYFGEGLQSYFNVNAYSYQPNGMHNSVSTRTKLCSYDRQLFLFIHELWPCGNHYIKRCHSRGSEFYQRLNTDCPLGQWYSRRTSLRRGHSANE